MTSITSEEVNYLIYRYLQEAGYLHSAYCFGQESFIAKAAVAGTAGSDPRTANVPPGALIALFQKGLHYVSIETHLNDDGTERECCRPFSLLEQHVCETPQQQAAKAGTEDEYASAVGGAPIVPPPLPKQALREPTLPAALLPATVIPVGQGDLDIGGEAGSAGEGALDSGGVSPPQDDILDPGSTGIAPQPPGQKRVGRPPGSKTRKRPKPSSPDTNDDGLLMDIDAAVAVADSHTTAVSDGGAATVSDSHTTAVSDTHAAVASPPGANHAAGQGWGSDEDVTFVAAKDGLRPNITNCASVSPSDGDLMGQLVATGTGDGWLQCWSRPIGSKSFKLFGDLDFSSGADVTAINWRSNGTALAIASMDGSLRLMAGPFGEDSSPLDPVLLPQHHKGPVFSARWSPSGAFLLTAGMDQSAAVWDCSALATVPGASLDDSLRRVYRHHKGPIMDLDWRTDESFATGSVDRTIVVYNNWREQEEPVQVFSGHEDEVNAVAWDPTRTILASCSDDATARLWRTSQPGAVHVLGEHRKEIYAVRWSPVESRTGSSWLATASLDTTVRLWDAETGRCIRTLAKHSDAAFAVAFSPDGDYLATGARDSVVHVWSLREGMVVRSFHGGPGGVFDLAWLRDGRTLVAASSNDVSVLDMSL